MERRNRPAALVVLRPAPAIPAPAVSIPRQAARGVVCALLGLTAFGYSLATLVEAKSGALAAVGAAILVGTAGLVAAHRRPGLAIHDRYTDWIVGVPLAAGGLGILLLLPGQMSVFFWHWRIDLLALPFFAAGAISLVFGVRALWQLRLVMLALGLAWPLHSVGLFTWPAELVAGAGVALSAVLMIHSLRSTARSSVAARPRSAAVPHAWRALIVLLLAAIGSGIADQSLAHFSPLLSRTGQPRLAVANSVATITGWDRLSDGGYPWIQGYLGATASWDRFSYWQLGVSPVLVDVMQTPDLSGLTTNGLDAFYRLHGYRLVSAQDVGLGDGLVGHLVAYRLSVASCDVFPGPSCGGRTAAWRALYWDWPVQGKADVVYQRIVISLAETRTDTSEGLLTGFARAYVRSEAR